MQKIASIVYSGVSRMRTGFTPVHSSTRLRGFTLIELMITMVIIGVLASIALPSYTRYMARAYRAEARIQLLQVAQFMQRFYAANDSYEKDRSSPAINVINAIPASLKQSLGDASTSAAFYNLSIPTLTSMSFSLRMAPVGGNRMANDECGTFAIDSTGVKTVLINDVEYGRTDATRAQRDACWK